MIFRKSDGYHPNVNAYVCQMRTLTTVGLWAALALFADMSFAACPLIIAHRGASGHRPEHTMAAYELAIAQGADFLEVDIVATGDGMLIARHENELSDTTDVASRPEFSDRKTTKLIDGIRRAGWFTEDFSLEEVRRLRTIERMPSMRPNNQVFDGQFMIPSLQDVIDLVRRESRAAGKEVGLYVETKHPTHFRSLGLPLEHSLVELLHRNGYRTAADPVYLESFEPTSLRKLTELTGLRLVQLIGAQGELPYDFVLQHDSRTTHDLLAPAGLTEIAGYAAALGVTREWIYPIEKTDRIKSPTFIREAHEKGLQVHVWTFRNENYFLPADLRVGDAGHIEFPRREGNALGEYQRYFRLGVDGVFSDFPATARQALTIYRKSHSCP